MKELVPVAFDDLHVVEDREKVPANQTINFGLGWQWYEIDLTETHAKELRSFLSRYIKASRKAGQESKKLSVVKYNRGMREFADRNGIGNSRDGYLKTPSGYTYSKKLRDEYAESLASGVPL